MLVLTRNEEFRKIHFFRGMDEEELSQLASLCTQSTFAVGELVQKKNEPANRVNFIIGGKVGAIARMPGTGYGRAEMVIDTLNVGDAFGWSSLIYGTPWSTLRVLEPTTVLSANASDILQLCESNCRLGYILMKNLSALVSSRLRRNRISTLNTIAAIRGEG
jgi:CRP-like cAMP-binding protein